MDGIALCIALAMVLHPLDARCGERPSPLYTASDETIPFDLAAAKQMAERGDASAQFELGYYLTLMGKAHWQEGFQWDRKAALKGHPGAQYNLATLYDLGKGVKKNSVEARKWGRAAAQQGHAGAQSMLGWWSHATGRDKEAVKWYESAARQGGASAPFIEGLLGSIYATGGHGVTQSWADAYFWYSLAALSPDPLKTYARLRDQAKQNLAPTQITEIRTRVEAWKPVATPATLAATRAQDRINAFIKRTATKHD